MVLYNSKCILGSVCGDGLFNDTFEECDDGNNDNYDGCNKNCRIEANYKCYEYIDHFGVKSTLYCAYNKSLDLKLLSIEKIKYKNELKLTVSVSGYN
jgi:cysteine-rich repeat protein